MLLGFHASPSTEYVLGDSRSWRITPIVPQAEQWEIIEREQREYVQARAQS